MNTIVFTISFSIIAVGMLALLLLDIKMLPVAKAGKVTKYYKKTNLVLANMPQKLIINGEKIDVHNDFKMIVRGNSMSPYKIYDGQCIYVKKFLNNDDKLNITTFPVLVLNIVDNPDKSDAEYKLRKFIGYIKNDDNWSKIFDLYKSRIKISKADFIAQCTKKYNSIPDKERDSLILSETFDDEKKVNQYSLHPSSTIFGKVEYALSK